MRWHRTTARVSLALLLVGLPPTAEAHQPPSPVASAPPKRIVFPLVAKTHYQDDFSAPRPQGGHEATDIMSDWRAPAVAVETGKIKIWTSSARAGCMLYLYGRSGTTYLYVHLNNDLTRRNDNRGGCKKGVAFAPSLTEGQTVHAGELLGYAGDSGDANGKHPHVHFELRPRGGAAVSPYRWLRRAHQPIFALQHLRLEPAVDLVTVTLAGTVRSVALGDVAPKLVVRVQSVRLSSGERFSVRRDVVLSVPPTATVERAAGARRLKTPLAAVRPGETAVIDTALIERNLRAQLAAPAVLEAESILLTAKAG